MWDADRRDRNHLGFYVLHWFASALAGALACTEGWVAEGTVLIAVLLFYQVATYWHVKDTLKLDLRDHLIPFTVAFVVALVVRVFG